MKGSEEKKPIEENQPDKIEDIFEEEKPDIFRKAKWTPTVTVLNLNPDSAYGDSDFTHRFDYEIGTDDRSFARARRGWLGKVIGNNNPQMFVKVTDGTIESIVLGNALASLSDPKKPDTPLDQSESIERLTTSIPSLQQVIEQCKGKKLEDVQDKLGNGVINALADYSSEELSFVESNSHFSYAEKTDKHDMECRVPLPFGTDETWINSTVGGEGVVHFQIKKKKSEDGTKIDSVTMLLFDPNDDFGMHPETAGPLFFTQNPEFAQLNQMLTEYSDGKHNYPATLESLYTALSEALNNAAEEDKESEEKREKTEPDNKGFEEVPITPENEVDPSDEKPETKPEGEDPETEPEVKWKSKIEKIQSMGFTHKIDFTIGENDATFTAARRGWLNRVSGSKKPLIFLKLTFDGKIKSIQLGAPLLPTYPGGVEDIDKLIITIPSLQKVLEECKEKKLEEVQDKLSNVFIDALANYSSEELSFVEANSHFSYASNKYFEHDLVCRVPLPEVTDENWIDTALNGDTKPCFQIKKSSEGTKIESVTMLLIDTYNSNRLDKYIDTKNNHFTIYPELKGVQSVMTEYSDGKHKYPATLESLHEALSAALERAAKKGAESKKEEAVDPSEENKPHTEPEIENPFDDSEMPSEEQVRDNIFGDEFKPSE